MFDSGCHGGARFMIKGPNSCLIAIGGSHLYDMIVPSAQLRSAWVEMQMRESICR